MLGRGNEGREEFWPSVGREGFSIYNSRRLRDIQRGFEMNLLQFEMDSKGIEKNSRRGGKGFFPITC